MGWLFWVAKTVDREKTEACSTWNTRLGCHLPQEVPTVTTEPNTTQVGMGWGLKISRMILWSRCHVKLSPQTDVVYLLNLLFDLHSLLTPASFESRADWESILIAAIASVVPQWCVQKNELLANRTCFAADLTRRWCFSSRYKWFHSSEIHRWHLLGRRYGI